MKGMRWLVACVAVSIGCGSAGPPSKPAKARSAAERAADAAAAVAALQAAKFSDARELATTALAADPGNASAAAVRAIARYQAAVDSMLDEWVAVIEQADKAGGFDHARMRKTFAATDQALAAIDADLAVVADDAAFGLELCLACWEYDWNRNGRVDDRDRRLLELEYDPVGGEIPEADPRRRPTFRFDAGDAIWARAMLSFQRAGLSLLLAYEWDELDKLLTGGRDPGPIRIALADPGRVAAARKLILAGLDYADASRAAFLAETDDDREWVPNPKQVNHPLPLPVDDAVYATWAGVVSDVRGLVAGDTGIRVADVFLMFDDDWPALPTGFIDVGAMLSKPKAIVIDFAAIERHTDGGEPNLHALMKDVFGDYYVPSKPPTPLVGRLKRMADDVTGGEETFERKLRYLFWLN